MEYVRDLIIVVDPGHGGEDGGVSFDGRAEKDDNLALGLAVRDELKRQGANVAMTRDSDISLSLRQRAEIANSVDADLLLSLHRNASFAGAEDSYGVQNHIYLTAPESSSGEAARVVLNELVAAGVQKDRGVRRSNYYILRKATMPAMLLDVGFIDNAGDNQLLDTRLHSFAKAITKGVLAYFGFECRDCGTETPSESSLPEADIPIPEQAAAGKVSAAESRAVAGSTQPAGGAAEGAPTSVRQAQIMLDQLYHSGPPPTGVFDSATRQAFVRALQTELNNHHNASLTLNGLYSPATRAAMPVLSYGHRGPLVRLLQILLALLGYRSSDLGDLFGAGTYSAVRLYQRNNFLNPNGALDLATLGSMLAYSG